MCVFMREVLGVRAALAANRTAERLALLRRQQVADAETDDRLASVEDMPTPQGKPGSNRSRPPSGRRPRSGGAGGLRRPALADW